MSISFFSIFLIIFIFSCLKSTFKKGIQNFFKQIFTLYIAVSLHIDTGYFIKIGSISVGFSTFLSLLLLLIGLIYIFLGGKFDKKIFICGIGLILSIGLGYFNFLLNPYTGGIIQELADWDQYIWGNAELVYNPQLTNTWKNLLIAAIRYPIILSIAYCNIDRKEWADILKILAKVTLIVLIYGIIESLIKFVFHESSTKLIINKIFGEVENAYLGTDRLQGLFLEASHYSMGLFCMGIISLLGLCGIKNKVCEFHNHHKSLYYTNFLLVIILMVFSTSFSTLIYIVILFVAYGSFYKKIDIRIILFIGVSIVAVVITILTHNNIANTQNSFFTRLDRVFRILGELLSGGDVEVSSESVRVMSILSMIRIIFSRPFFGVGLGITDAHSTLFALIANIGVIGVLFFGAILYRFGNIKKHTILFFILFLFSITFTGGVGFFSRIEYPAMLSLAGITIQCNVASGDYLEKNKMCKGVAIYEKSRH